MNHKPFTPYQKRALKIMAAAILGGVALWTVIYFTAPEHKRHHILVIAFSLLCVSCAGLAFLVFLYKRYPAPEEKNKDE